MKRARWFSRWRRPQVPSRRVIAAERQAAAREEQQPVAAAYRRNRILNSRDTASPAETSERLAAHQSARVRQRRMHWLGIGVLAGLLVLAILWQLALSVTVLTPDAASGRHPERYQAALARYYAERPVERLRLLLDTAALQRFLLEQVPEVKTARLEGRGLASATLKLTFRRPVAQWSSGATHYFVDEDGVSFERNYFAAPAVAVRDESGVPATSGQEVINRRFLSFLGQSVALLNKHQLPVKEAVLPQGAVRQIAFHIKQRPTTITMTLDRAAQAQVEQAAAALRWLDQRGRRPGYVDVRADQRVFYR